jgi:hypothetical protein
MPIVAESLTITVQIMYIVANVAFVLLDVGTAGWDRGLRLGSNRKQTN